jgi:hypothetical protein
MPQAIEKATTFVNPMALLSRLASDAMVAGADPSAPATPDHELLLLCDDIVTLKARANQLLADIRSIPSENAQTRQLWDELRRTERAMRKPILRAGKLPAISPAGIFGKALVVRRCSNQAAVLAKSLADDLLTNTKLRNVLWPAVCDLAVAA